MSSADAQTATREAVHSSLDFGFQNTYARLPERFFARVNPTPGAAPRLIKVNGPLAETLGLDPEALESAEGVAILAGNRVASGSEPLAQAYAGHQFGNFVPQLGDGRAILLGEVVARNGVRYDVQLKGSGRTPFSRGGDGRAAIGPVLREYIVSEAMAALGIPTTRALAAVATGDTVMRETALPGAVLTRVAASHLRVGTFQYFAARRDVEALRTLADFAVARHYPEAVESGHRYRALLEGVIRRQAGLVAQWMLVGFIHGVMNTDNTSISGETIDFGPCAFLEAYDPDEVFSSIDLQGRYKYSHQPHAAQWNLARLAEALLPLIAEEQGGDEAAVLVANEALTGFAQQFEAAHLAGLRRKLGLLTEREGDAGLAGAFLELMAESGADFTLSFRRLCDAAAEPADAHGLRELFREPAKYDLWAVGWRRRLADEDGSEEERVRMMRGANPVVIPRNHLVGEALDAAVEMNFEPFEVLLAAVSRPFEDRGGMERFSTPALLEERILRTFCGT